MAIYKVQDPEGNLREIEGPDGASDNEILAQAKTLFKDTAGGAATGNPNIQRQGLKARRNDIPTMGEALTQVGGSAAMGGVMGAFAPEILTGLGGAASVFPPTAPAAPFLLGAGSALRGQRLASAASGAVSGAASSIAGQGAQAAGAGPGLTATAEIVAGGITPEFKNLVGWGLKKITGIPAIGDAVAAVRKYIGKEGTMTDAEERYVKQQIDEIRGGSKSDAPLKTVGDAMGDEANRVNAAAQAQTLAAERGALSVGGIQGARPREYSDIGDELRQTIVARNKAGMDQRKADYDANVKARDEIVRQRESGQSIAQQSDYRQLLSHLESELVEGKRSPSVQAGIQKILSELQSNKTTFQAVDDVRRKLGDAFRGKPAEGYDAIGEGMAKELYGRVSEIQKRFAGGPQAKLLDDYAAQTEGLEIFRSKTGSKATAVDRYNDNEFATDSSKLPKAYLQSRAGVKALKELTGNETMVNQAALDYANRQLQNAKGGDVRSFLSKNSEWLKELPFVQRSLDDFANRLEGAERASVSAADFARKAAENSKLLVGNQFPAQRAVDLIRSGNDELWSAAGPAINASPQAKTQVLDAVRQVVADQARSKETLNLFNRSIRPGMEKSGLATTGELEFIAMRLENIQKLNIPEVEKLGMAKRLILNAATGWSSATTSGTVSKWSRDKVVPE